MESLRSKSWIKHVLIALLGLNFLAINNFAYAIVESEASPLLTKYEALSTFSVFEVSGDVNETRFKKENCHDMVMSVEEADSTSSDPAQSCCDEPCDCNGPTCGGASVVSRFLYTSWLSKQISALFIPSHYLNLPDGPTSPPPISPSI